jgi:hypothetical protein
MNRWLCAKAAIVAAAVVTSVSSLCGAEESPEEKKQCLAAAEAGQSQRDDGHYLAARQSFLNCSRDVCPKVIAQSCTQWLRDLVEVAPTVVLGAKDGQGNDLSDVKVTLDGQPFATSLDGKPVATDSGEHVFRFEREGSLPAEMKVVLRVGEKARVVTAVLQSAKETPPPPEPSKNPPEPEAPPPPEPLMSAHHVTAGVMAIAALASAGVGAFFLAQSSQAKNDAANLRSGMMPGACFNTGASSGQCPALNDKVNSQFADSNTATGLFIGAGGLAVAAIVTWLVWPHSAPAAPQSTASARTWSIAPAIGGTTIGLQGTFE